jgi:predicted nicotinamide N-methyase
MTRIALPFPIPTGIPIQDTLFREGKVKLRIRAAICIDDLVVDEEDLLTPPYWAQLWPSAPGLARFLVRRRLRDGGPALELGAGSGLPGLALRSLGLDVLQTDLFPDALRLAQWNAQRNGFADGAYVAADWQHWPLRARFPLIIGSDILYERAVHEALRDTLLRSLLPDGVAFIADPGRPPSLSFAASRETEGWSVQMHELAENGVPVFVYEMRLPARGACSAMEDISNKQP